MLLNQTCKGKIVKVVDGKNLSVVGRLPRPASNLYADVVTHINHVPDSSKHLLKNSLTLSSQTPGNWTIR